MEILFPVIMAVPPAYSDLPGGERQRALSRYARMPLAVSAQKAGFVLPVDPGKDERGAPRPAGGLWWSVTHKPGFVGGLVSRGRIGIDVEEIVSVSDGLFKKIVSPAEERLFDGDRWLTFFRCWTAKEAVLKATGRGLGGLAACRVAAVADARRLALVFADTPWMVEHFYFAGHLAAVAATAKMAMQWTLLEAPAEERSRSELEG